MRKLILASGSPQRKKLLKLLGVKFSVKPSKVQEIKKIRTTCSALVKSNAVSKARAIASQINEGVVIGADTVVYIGNKQLIGKPRNYQDARKILKILFSRPQWVYTGVAVIDTASGKTIIDYEKTKIFMLPLTKEEMGRYHQKVSPFDKAGGFDIEGWGSIFIQRIEGCYSNVIGLPMAKLSTMLKKVGVSILSLFMVIHLSGCVSEFNLATQKEETLLYGTEKEIRIGESVAMKVEKSYEIVKDVDANERLDRIFDKIVLVCDRKELVYFVKILDDDLVNAVSLPGGYVYIFRGLLDKMENDDQIAGVIAHEIGHITAKHGMKRLQASYGAMLLQVAAVEAGGRRVSSGVSLALSSIFMEYSQKDELEADRLGIKYMRKAGYDPNEMIQVLNILKKEQEKAPIRKFSYWRTHPHIPQRMAVVNQEITGSLEFKDYLNLMGDSY